MRIRYSSEKPLHLSSLYLRAASPHAELVEAILNSINRNKELLNDLAVVAQYDLSSKVARKVKGNVKRLIKQLRLKERKLVSMSSGTELMGIVTYYAIEELLSEHNLYFYLEPEVLNIEKPFDYALIDEVNNRIVALVKVKRLLSLENLLNYMKDFMNKAGSIHKNCDYVILHLHITPEITKDKRTHKLIEILKEAVNTALNTLTNIRIITTHINKDRFNTFKNTLTKEIKPYLTKKQ